MGAEMIAQKYGFSRDELDAFCARKPPPRRRGDRARRFHRRDRAARRSRRRGRAVCHTADEGIRYDATIECIGAVKLLQEGGVHHRRHRQPDLRRRRRR